MTFAAHAIAGAGVHATLGLLILRRGFTRTWWWWLVVSGGLFGMAPDAVDWIVYHLGLSARWVIYGLMHHGWISDILQYVPAYWLHLEIDKVVHVYPGYAWWPDYAWLEILHWFLGAGLIFWTFVFSKRSLDGNP